MDKLLIFGIGAKGEEVLELIREYNLYDVVGFAVDSNYIKGPSFMGLPVFPSETIENHVSKDVLAFVAVSQMYSLNQVRAEKYTFLKEKGFHFANIISPKAIVRTKEIGEGNWIKDYAVVDYGAKVGNNNVIGLSTEIAHFSKIGNHNYLAGKSILAGDAVVGNSNFIGMSSTIFQGIRVGNECLIGSGCYVNSNLPDCSLVVAPKPVIIQKDSDSIKKYLEPKGNE